MALIAMQVLIIHSCTACDYLNVTLYVGSLMELHFLALANGNKKEQSSENIEGSLSG
jgi:hypothetical protein